MPSGRKFHWRSTPTSDDGPVCKQPCPPGSKQRPNHKPRSAPLTPASSTRHVVTNCIARVSSRLRGSGAFAIPTAPKRKRSVQRLPSCLLCCAFGAGMCDSSPQGLQIQLVCYSFHFPQAPLDVSYLE